MKMKMVRDTVKEYETVEREITKYKCDNCGVRKDEEDITTVLVAPEDRDYIELDVDEGARKKHLCDGCNSFLSQIEWEDQVRGRWERKKELMRIATSKKILLIPVFYIGMLSYYITKQAGFSGIFEITFYGFAAGILLCLLMFCLVLLLISAVN